MWVLSIAKELTVLVETWFVMLLLSTNELKITYNKATDPNN